MTLGQTLTRAALEAREAMAAAEFAPDVVGSACKAAAAAGHPRCLIVPSQAVNICETEAVKALTAALGKQQLTLTWLPRANPGEPPWFALEIEWGQRKGFG